MICACAALAGCVYIPPGEDDAGIKPADFKIGSTSRSEVLRVLGDPLIDDGRFILDQLDISDGSFFFFFFIPAHASLNEQHVRLLLEFNDANILERMDVEQTCGTRHKVFRNLDVFTGGGNPAGIEHKPCGAAPDRLPLNKLEHLGELVPFNKIKTYSFFRGATFSPNGNLLAAHDSSNRIYLIDFVSRTIELISIVPDFVRSVVFSPDGNSLAVLSWKIRIIDLKTRKQILLYDGFGYNPWNWSPDGATAMAYAPSGDVIASGGIGGVVKIWEASSGREIASWVAHKKRVQAIAFSTDGAILATSGRDGFVRLWDRKTGAELGAIKRSGTLAFSDDGKLLTIGSTYHAEVWRLGRGTSGASQGQKLTLHGPVDMIFLPYVDVTYPDDFGWYPHSLGFTPGGRRVLQSIGSTVIWDWTEKRKTPIDFPFREHFLAFGPDGQTMATSTSLGVRLWKLLGTK